MQAIRISALVFCVLIAPLSVSASSIQPWMKAARDAEIDPHLLLAVAFSESQRAVDGGLSASPWPWAVNQAGTPHYFATRDEALSFVSESLEAGITNIDISAFQINFLWHGHRVSTVDDLLDPYTSAYVAAGILKEAMRSSPGDLLIGIGRYHSWDDERAMRYGARVLSIFHQLRELEVFGP